ncbi:MAG: archease [Candidatus Babeliales bacterium]
MKDFEQLPHTADLKIRVYGSSLQELFKHALIGMFQSIGPQSSACVRKDDRLVCQELPVHHEVAIKASTKESLLVDFLSEALYLSDVHNEAYLDVAITDFNEHHIKATLYGIKIDRFDVVEIKAVTYHDLEIKHHDTQWQADIVFDI